MKKILPLLCTLFVLLVSGDSFAINDCTDNSQCGGATPFCIPGDNKCAQCRTDADCGPGVSCDGHNCLGSILDNDLNNNSDPVPVPEMEEWLTLGFIVAAGGVIYFIRRRKSA